MAAGSEPRCRPRRGPLPASRRAFLRLAGGATVAGLAGCAGGGPEDGDAEPVPAVYVTATARGGAERDPDAVAAKPVVNYRAEPNDGQRCADCRFFVPDRNDDGLGACAIVEGVIDPSGWCSSFAPVE